MYSCVKLTIESTVSQYYFQKFYNCILIIFKHVSIMIIIVEIRRYLECSIRNRFLMEQYKTDSPVTTFINRSKVWWLPWYYINMIHSGISPLQTEEKQSEWTDNDGQSPILGSHRPRKQRQRRGWRVLILQQRCNNAWLIGHKVKRQRAQETKNLKDMVSCFYSCPWTNPFSFLCWKHRNCVLL